MAITVRSYGEAALAHLGRALEANQAIMAKLSSRLVDDVKRGRSLIVFGSGHSAIFAMELYHRAGGASFILPVMGEYLLPSAGPSVVRVLERTPGAATPLLDRARPLPGEMIWIASQSGINAAGIDLALEARKRGLHTVAFTSRVHSAAVESRHPSGKRLFEACDETVDLGGFVGDAAVEVAPGLRAGPLSTLGSVMLGHSIVVSACAELERQGVRCLYTSVNTPEGQALNLELEKKQSERDYLLR